MKFILPIIISFLFIISCSTQRMYNSIHGIYNIKQIDSICRREKLPFNLSKWINGSLIDYETNDSIYQYMFIKQLGNNEIVYSILIDDSLYYFNKRITETIK